MDTLFYIFGFFVFILQVQIIIKWNKIFNEIKYDATFLKITGVENSNSDNKHLVGLLGITTVLMLFYNIIGLLTDNWILFLLIICLSLSMRILLKILSTIFKKFKYSNSHRYILMIMIMITCFLTLLTVLNHFHFNVDFYKLITNII